MGSGLQAEIHKQQPFEHLEEEAFLSVLRTHSVLVNTTERFLRGFGLSIATYNVLRILRAAGEDGKSCSAIGEHMVARVPDVTRLVDRLERQSLVTRKRGSADRRVVRVRVTDDGLTLLDQVDRPLIELYQSMLGHMNNGVLRQLCDLLFQARSAASDRLAPANDQS